jgi:multisubunit Na+/H+ antiporter MnhB subunit
MDLGTLLGAVIVLAIVGVALYLVFRMVPMEPTIKIAIQVVVVLFVVLWLLSLIGVTPRFR